MILPTSFYARPATEVAPDLLGDILVRRLPDGTRISGRIVETEAYSGIDDLASHGRRAPTPRSRPMWGAPGHSYVYFTYGKYWMSNITCDVDGVPGAVLIRAIEPVEGIAEMALRRPGVPRRALTSGPARLCLAMEITRALNEVPVTSEAAGFWVEAGEAVSSELVRTGPRIGIDSAPEPWRSIQWRWWVAGSADVSRGDGLR